MLIALLDYYPIYLDGASDGLKEFGNLRFLELYKEGKKNGIFFEIYNKRRHRKYDLIIFLNEPRINNILSVLINNLLIKRIEIIYMGDETPLCRPRITTFFIPFIYKMILINTLRNKRLAKKRNYFLYTSASIPDKEKIINNRDFILRNNRKKLLCYVGSNKLCLSRKGSYIFRNKLLQVIGKDKNFSLYGRHWDESVIPIDYPLLAIINRIKVLKKLVKNYYQKKYPRIISKGSIKSKLKKTNEYKFTLAIEPFIGEPKMLLDKIFDPMLSGSIPVYYGPEGIDIPDDCYIRINNKTNINSLMKYLNSISEKDISKYRKNIYNFLKSDKANRFRYSYFARQIIDILRKN